MSVPFVHMTEEMDARNCSPSLSKTVAHANGIEWTQFGCIVTSCLPTLFFLRASLPKDRFNLRRRKQNLKASELPLKQAASAILCWQPGCWMQTRSPASHAAAHAWHAHHCSPLHCFLTPFLETQGETRRSGEMRRSTPSGICIDIAS